MERRAIDPPGLPEATYHYGMQVGSTIYLSGALALDERGEVVSSDPARQAEQCLSNIEVVLAEAGASLRDVVHLRTYVTHWANREAVKSVIQARFGAKRPPSTTLVIASLGLPECCVEIEAVAVCDG